MSTLKEIIGVLHDGIFEKPNKVLQIFNNFFGEDRVDMQGFPTKSQLEKILMGWQVHELFDFAGMNKFLPAVGLNRNDCLENLDMENLPEESMELLRKALLSSGVERVLSSSVTRGFILVYFPNVTVTNEYDRSIDITELFVKVPLSLNGTEDGLFTMNRGEYTVAQLRSGYMHSHASAIPTQDFQEFSHVCLGSGPLNGTQTQLATSFDEDRWNLFCLELSKYVEVESISGVPYHRLEGVSVNSSSCLTLGRLSESCVIYGTNTLKNELKKFLKYYLEHNNLTFSYRNGVYSLGTSYFEYLISISNSFIKWVNDGNANSRLTEEELLRRDVIGKFVVIGSKVYRENSSDNSYLERLKGYIGETICTFKGRTVKLRISDIDKPLEEGIKTTLLSDTIASFLLNRILRTVNYRYGRNQEDPSTPAGKVRYKV